MSDETPIHWRDDLESLDIPSHPLPKYATVIFDVSGSKISVRIVADTLYVTEKLGRNLAIIPSAANAVYLKGEV